MPEPAACFEVDGERFVPTVLAQGPWAAGALHGGPTSALLAHVCDSHPGLDGRPMLLTRIAIDLLRPVPMVPLQVEVRLARPGRRVDWVDASLRAGEVEVARATSLRIGEQPLALPAGVDPWSRGVSGDVAFDGAPDAGQIFRRREDDAVPGFHNLGMDLRFVRGLPDQPGPGQVWGRPRFPIIAGLPVSPLMAAMAISDFGNAAGSLVPPHTHSYVNADVVVALWRRPRGEWVGIDAVTRADPDAGTALAEMALHDLEGPVGRAQQTVLMSSRA